MIIQLQNYGKNAVWFAIPNIVILGVFGLAAFGFGIFLWVLFVYHIFLIATNQTTVEYLKEFKQKHPANPFAKLAQKFSHQKHQKVLHVSQKEKQFELPV